MRRPITAALLALALGLSACGGEDEPETTTGADAPAATATPEATAAPADIPALAAKISKDLGEKPTIPKPEGSPPAELVTEDLVTGKGKAAKQGDEVSVQYVGASWSTGQEFDASWDRGQAFKFGLGAREVIPGWDQGVAGMKPGGRRLLVIPPDLGYGPAGQPPVIGQNETLLFVVDLKKAT